MRGGSFFKWTVLSVLAGAAVVCCGVESARAQQSNSANFNQAAAKARDYCTTLFSDRAFDPLRDKIPLGWEKPTLSMLTNKERLRSADKPLMDLMVKALEQCRAALTPVYAMLPPAANATALGTWRAQDALIAELYTRKITFGECNVKMNELAGQVAPALSGSLQFRETAPSANQKTAAGPMPLPLSRPPMRDTTPQIIAPRESATRDVRLALVIGDGSYVTLPRLANPENDAQAIADVLKKMGFGTRLILNGIRAGLAT